MPGVYVSRRNILHRGRASAAPPVVFPTLPGLVGRWNALNVTTSGPNVTSATDLSGNGHNLTPSGGNVPLNATGYNGHPAFGFLAANAAALVATSVPMGTGNDGYCFFVGQMLPGTTTFGGAVSYGVGAVNDFNGAGSASFFARNNGGNSLTDVGGVINTNNTAVSLAANMRVGVNLHGSLDNAATVYLNNVSGNTPGVVGNWGTNGTIVVGGRYLSGVDTTNLWEGPITEIVVGNATLSSTDLNALDKYLTDQWGA